MNKIYKTLKTGGFSSLMKKIESRIKKIFACETFRYEILAYRLYMPFFKYQLKRRKSSPQFLFVLCPARSGSTLLAHILSSHPEISGKVEHHIDYNHSQDLNKLIYRTAVLNKDLNIKKPRFFLEKMVWNYKICQEIIKNSDVKFIFLLREPKANLDSMAKLLKKWQDPDSALNYYQSRLINLQQSAVNINNPNRCLYINYDKLLYNTEETLNKLQQFLSTKIPFTEEYTTSKNTGNLRYGDSSSNIKAGKIIRKNKTEKAFFTQNTYEKAISFYQECNELLEHHCA